MRTDSTALVQIQNTAGEWIDAGYLQNVANKNWFEFSKAYWEIPDRPVMGQMFEERGPNWKPSAKVALPRWFGHLLPEGRLKAAVAQAAHTNSKNEYDLLVRLGETDLPGALRVTPDPSQTTQSIPDVDALEELEENKDPILKFSLAGAQLKFSVHGDKKSITVPAKGIAGNLILKFPDGRPGFDGVPQAELGALTLAHRSGIPTPEAFLVNPDSVTGLEDWSRTTRGQALAVRRFDRRGAGLRVHMEEFAQIIDVPTASDEAKYRKATLDTVATVLAGISGNDVVGDIIDRIVLNVLVGNGDAHLKNWAVVYKDGRTPTLSPVYDVVPTVLYMNEDDLGLKLRKSKRFEDVNTNSFDSIARRTGYGELEARRRAADAVDRIVSEFSLMSEYLTADNFSRLERRLSTLPLAQAKAT